MNNVNRFSAILSYKLKVVFIIASIIAIILAVFVFWSLKDINSLLYNTNDQFSESELSTYYQYYDNVLTDDNSNNKDLGYFLLTFIFKKIGFSFKFFLFICLFLYYLTLSIVFYKITFCKKWFLYFILIVLGSYFLVPLFLVVNRQGIATLTLIFILFAINSELLILRLFTVLLASTIHFSAIFFLPFIILEKFIKNNRVKLIDKIFITTFLLYFIGFFEYTSNLFINFSSYFNLNIRALGSENDYKTGFTIYKAVSIAIPPLLFRLTNFSNKYIGFRIYIFFCFACIIGMFLSGLPYHDRILLYGWTLSPILITCFIISFLNNLLSISKKKRY
jgi:hypothetical protein